MAEHRRQDLKALPPADHMLHPHPHRSPSWMGPLRIRKQGRIPPRPVRGGHAPVRVVVLKSIAARIPNHRDGFGDRRDHPRFHRQAPIGWGAGRRGGHRPDVPLVVDRDDRFAGMSLSAPRVMGLLRLGVLRALDARFGSINDGQESLQDFPNAPGVGAEAIPARPLPASGGRSTPAECSDQPWPGPLRKRRPESRCSSIAEAKGGSFTADGGGEGDLFARRRAIGGGRGGSIALVPAAARRVETGRTVLRTHPKSGP